jgi:hypothetical protein
MLVKSLAGLAFVLVSVLLRLLDFGPGDDALLVVVLAVYCVGFGALIGRWWAVLLPLLWIAVAGIVEPGPQDSRGAVVVLTAVLVVGPGMVVTGLGVGLRKLVEAGLRRRRRAAIRRR